MSTATAAPPRENVLYEKKGPIAYVTLNRPKVLNALNKATIAELNEVFHNARDDAAVHGVILTGAGDKAFAAGADIGEMANDTPADAENKTRHGQRLTRLIENLANVLGNGAKPPAQRGYRDRCQSRPIIRVLARPMQRQQQTSPRATA